MGMNEEIRITGRLICPRDELDAVRAGLAEHVRLSRAEPGCLAFEIAEDPNEPGVFHVAETFRDAAAFEAHRARAAASDWAPISRNVTRDLKGLP